jgi:DNA mismatch repair protein MutL
MNINILNSKVISQIAAGEVVERPASVVKELIENSIDAGSTQISIEIKSGGINLIRVTDNGTGISNDEAELAFERHATSKIRNIDDLEQLKSLGFRGEALPSIASVSQVQMLTCHKSASTGTYLSLEDGKVVQHEARACAQGTTISVQNLFRKIPARLKFLKSESSESGRIAEIVSRYALAYPEIKFNFSNENKFILRTPGNAKLIDSVSAVYGLEIAQNMIEVQNISKSWNATEPDVKIIGLLGTPRIARSNRNFLSFFVNRRWVNNRILGFAIEEAYRGLIMQGKHPICVLNIDISPQHIDVNVHPAKTEIKFQDERSIFAEIQKAVRQSLLKSTPVPQVEEIKTHFALPSTQYSSILDASIKTPNKNSAPNSKNLPTPLISLPLLRVLGQMAKNYVVAEGPDGLFIIDQHAAHERILLEKIQNQRTSRTIEVQGLLEPAIFEVEPRQATILDAHLNDLSDFGFAIEAFGDKTFILRSVPAILKDKDWKSFLHQTLDTLTGSWIESFTITLACHSAIRAGQVLSDIEMRELIKQLEETILPNSCPHGRPTIIHLTIQQLEKEFGRI